MPRRKSLLAVSLISLLPALHLQADCSPTVAVQVPATACKSGTATVGVIAVPGATYAWTVDGGQIAGDAASDHITITLGTNVKATASVTMTSGNCVSHGNGVIALHDPFGVRIVPIATVPAGEPLTIIWSYDNGAPGQQTISGDFGTVTLGPDVRNYTYAPQKSGSKRFAIDAVMKLPSSTPAPPAARQRAVSKSPAGASPCTVAQAAAAYEVGECAVPSVRIDAPASVVRDATFVISVDPQAGAVAAWTITNGLPATASGNSVTVTAGSSGEVGISVRLTRAACSDSADRSIAITAQPACDNPKASLTTDPLSCGSVFLNVSFTGTPPFKGLWSDYVPFETSSTSMVRQVTIPATYSILHFQDSICEGAASGVAVVSAYPSATISGKNNTACAGVDTVTARFTGKPPFSGCWSDGDCFQTSQTVITKLIKTAGLNTLAHGTDASGCAMTISGGVQTSVSQHVGLSKRCQWASNFGNIADLLVFYTGVFFGPAVTWSDGVKSDGLRFGVHLSQTTTYTVTSISDSVCAAIWDTPKSITIYPTPEPEFVPDSGDLCLGAMGTTTLVATPPPGTTVHWDVDYGTLISGQGTNSIQYQAGDPAPSLQMYVTCTFTFADPDRCPLTTRIERRVVPLEPNATLDVNTVDDLHAGKTRFFIFSLGWDITDWSITNSMNDSITVTGPCAPNVGYCNAMYTSTHGPGKSTITLHAKNACKTKDLSAVLTILP